MAFFGGHDTEDINVTLENSAKYESEVGLGIIALECTQFEAELFEDCVRSDMREYALVQEGADIASFQESAWETIKTKLIENLKKIVAKAKAFFNGWYAKVAARVMTDNKKFYQKFKKSVEGKDLSELEVKWEAPKDNKCEAKSIGELGDLKALEDLGAEEIIAKVYEIGETVDSHSEAKKVMLENSFDDEEEVKYVSVRTEVVNTLNNASEFKKAERAYKKANDNLTKDIKKLEKENSEVKNIVTIASVCAKAQVTILEVEVARNKKLCAQARRVFAKAVAYKPKTENAFDADLLAVEADALLAE